MVSFLPSSSPSMDFGTRGFGDTPTATITWSVSTVRVLPSIGFGLLLPLASGSPSSITCSTALHTAPFLSAMYSIGLCRLRKFIPSSLACLTSSSLAGISASERLYTIVTSAPSLFAVLQESIAVFPPPITSTFLPKFIGVSVFGSAASMRFTRVRYSLDDIMLMAFSPGMFMKLGSPAPLPTKNPLNPSSLSCSMVMVFPMIQSVVNSTPSFLRFSISTSTMWLGSLNSGIPYFSTPPISCSASNTCTS